jgi:hypothetical protein
MKLPIARNNIIVLRTLEEAVKLLEDLVSRIEPGVAQPRHEPRPEQRGVRCRGAAVQGPGEGRQGPARRRGCGHQTVCPVAGA